MAKPYDTLAYLLDKENIRDTVLRMMFAFDERDTATLIELVYTPEITLNYDKLLIGSGQEKVSSAIWAKRLEHLHDDFDTTQHIIQNLLVDLPQPSSTTTNAQQRPERCKVVAYAHGWFYKRNAEGRPRELGRRNGAHYILELVRLKEREEKGENPWRISVQNVRLDWQDVPV